MATGTTGTLTAAGSVTLTLGGNETRASIDISGTYGTVAFLIEGSADGTNYLTLAAIKRDTNAQATGSQTPADNATILYDVPVHKLSKVRVRATAVGSGTVAVGIQADAQLGLSVPAVTTTPTTYTEFVFPLVLAGIANGDLVTAFTPGFAGVIKKVFFVTDVPASTAAKLSTLNLEIGTTDLTGGTVALTTVSCNTKGKITEGAAVTAGNSFSATDAISVEASATTAFIEGSGSLHVIVASA